MYKMDIRFEIHPYLWLLFSTVEKKYPHKIITGYRGEKAQNEAFEKGRSKKKFPESKHNKKPATAVDVCPLPIDYTNDLKNLARFYHFAGFVLGTAELLCIPIRWGGDWDCDKDFTDQNFDDLQHFELI